MPYTRSGRRYVIVHDEQGESFRLFTEGLAEAQPWPEGDGEVPTIGMPRTLPGDDDDHDDEPEGEPEPRLTGERLTANGARGPPRSPSFKRRLETAVEVLREHRLRRLKVTDRDGSIFEFIDSDESDGAGEQNEIDTIMQRRKSKRNEAKS
jgi:hypothetical protein